MPEGVLVGNSGGVKVGPGGGVQSTNQNGTCPTCGCGDEPPAEWPPDGWIECSPCPGEPAITVVPVISVASIWENARNFHKGIIPYKCLVGSVLEPSIGNYVCVSAKPGNAVRTSQAGCVEVFSPTLAEGGWFFTCCDCRRSNTFACTIGEQVFPVSNVAPGISVDVSMPVRRRTAHPSDTFAIYSCCCPRVANGVTQTISGSLHRYEKTGPIVRDYVPPPGFLVLREQWSDFTFSGPSSLVHVTITTRTKQQLYDGTISDNTTTQEFNLSTGGYCGSFVLQNYSSGWLWGASGEGTATYAFTPNGYFGPPSGFNTREPITGSVTVGCNSASYNFTQNGVNADDHTQSPLYVEESGTESHSYSATNGCGDGCEDTGQLASPSIALIDGAWR